METENSGLNPQASTYFLVQGQSIGRLYDILNSNILVHHLKKWLSVLVEISLYLSFIGGFIFILAFPEMLQIRLEEKYGTTVAIEFNKLAGLILAVKIVLILLISPIVLFAILLGRNRKKNNLIHQAFTEVKKMKEGFDGAVKELKL